ncbi:DUF3099 domain-containing protein [Puerhibacterium sp. TATVAM-FAB25]|uniref:DUF3099 domain-containing protein n=1 Tax=Puerhibacterium sp. TATVAM-FAB25 TaxID=3093699 RepID=UPI00397C1630
MSSTRATSSRSGHGDDPDHEVHSITSAPQGLSEDQSRRTRRYLVQMGIRVVCLAGAVAIDHWVRWVLVVGAVVIPYVAVLFANAGRDRTSREVPPLPPQQPQALPEAPTAPEPRERHVVIEHVPDPADDGPGAPRDATGPDAAKPDATKPDAAKPDAAKPDDEENP